MSEETAFLKAILEEPDDDALRLVYADWLEERGDFLSDLIRVQCRLAKMPQGDPARAELLYRTGELIAKHGKGLAHRWSVVANQRRDQQSFFRRLSIPAENFWEHQIRWRKTWCWPDSFFRQLTMSATSLLEHNTTVLHFAAPPTISVDLDGLTLPQSVVELMPESVARENVLFLLFGGDDRHWIAMQEPNELELMNKLEFIFNRCIILVRAQSEQIIDAIDRHYPPGEVEFVDSILQEFEDAAIDVTENPQQF
jgi:uncharacterized protein (TIGR02996 family)